MRMTERLPIIFVRGFAGGQGAIDVAVDDPFYGLNEGSTHIRVGAGGQPRFYQFEGPLLRLINEQGYHVRVGGSQQQVLLSAGPGELPPDSVWIYRFYDEESGSFGNEPKPYDIGTSAQGLVSFISLVRSKTSGNPRVNLVAHSMGGLICRTALQRLMPDPQEAVSKLCTAGTPHGGIDPQLGGGIGGWLMDKFGPDGSNIFSPDHMREYMLPAGAPADAGVDPRTGQWDPRRMVGPFPASRVLSIVGTDSADYAVANGLSTVVMGVQSDGLVAIRNAYVVGSARAYVHRSHSGRYGLINSEETYQNLKCFFFGGLRLEVGLRGLVPAELQDRVWQADVRLAVRGIPVLLHEQTTAHYCPVDINAEARQLSTPDSPVPLVTLFLEPEAANGCRYALDISVTSLDETGGILGFGDHLEQVGDWEDTLILDIGPRDSAGLPEAHWQWNSELYGRIAGQEQLSNAVEWVAGGADSASVPFVPLTESGRKLLGDAACLTLTAIPWT